MLYKNVDLTAPVNVSSWRKTTYGTWKVTGDSQAYCLQTISVKNILSFIENYPKKITLTHIVGMCCAKMIKEHPEINRVIRFGKFYQRKDISIFFQVASDSNGEDLSGHTVKNIDKINLESLVKDLQSSAFKIKQGEDIHYHKVKKQMKLIPTIFLPIVIKAYGFVLYSLNLWSPLFGAPKDAFGSMMITNIGGLGIQTAFAPLVGYSRAPLVLAIGKVYKKPVVIDDKIQIEPCVDFCWTLDHRLIDGVKGAKMMQDFEKYMGQYH
ncbi:MAG: 2-oxo acid dehydrogenase subunit E2 [Bacteriovoracaceae bacterium]|jgi:pyruvate dehydrogenase E2 component (dihydrolipoamide acetyltransferase)|nr:2-oxo acid dehydrogenase subunit E2 [Bacteriovoracaceae bacterium]